MEKVWIRASFFFLMINLTFTAFIYNFSEELNLIVEVIFILGFIYLVFDYQRTKAVPDYIWLLVKNFELLFGKNAALKLLFLCGLILVTLAIIDLIAKLISLI